MKMKRGKLVLAVLALGLGLFMTMLDGTIVNISIPSIMRDFNASVSSISWVLDAYLLTMAVLILTMGRLADQFGRKLMYGVGLSIFTLGSLLCALSMNVGWLIGSRVFQAVGGAIMIPCTMAIMTASFPAEKRGAAMGIWAAIGVSAAAVGPSLGGVIVEHLNWNWVFYINLPIGILALALSAIGVTESRDPSTPKKLDLFGMAAFSVSVFSLALAVIRGEEWGWGSASIISLFVLSGVSLVVFILWEMRQSQPMLDLGLFRKVTFSSAIVCQLLVGFGMLGAMFLLTMFLQNVMGYSAMKAAVAITPIPATALVFSPIAGRLCDKIGPRIPTILGMVALGLGIFLFSQLRVDPGWGAVAWRAVIVGFGMALTNAPLAVAAMGATTAGKEGVGAGVLNASRLVGMTLGVAICAALLSGSISTHLSAAKAEVRVVVMENQQIPEQVKGMILAEVEQIGESGGRQSAPDIAAMVAGKGIPPDLLPQVEQLSQQISSTVRMHMTSAFNDVFPVIAAVAGCGIIPAVLLRRPKAKLPNRSPSA